MDLGVGRVTSGLTQFLPASFIKATAVGRRGQKPYPAITPETQTQPPSLSPAHFPNPGVTLMASVNPFPGQCNSQWVSLIRTIIPKAYHPSQCRTWNEKGISRHLSTSSHGRQELIPSLTSQVNCSLASAWAKGSAQHYHKRAQPFG